MKKLYRVVFIFLCAFLWCSAGAKASLAVRVSDFSSLKKELKSPSKSTIIIEDDIAVTETLVSVGTKIIVGDGGQLKRAVTKKAAFGGSLIKVSSGSLSLRSVRINGGGGASALKGKLYGYLVDVAGGQLAIRDKTVLESNKNSTEASDGGGAIRIRSGGTCILYGGSIRDNYNVNGGAGVRVDKGGAFYMKGGQISENICYGRAAVEGFEGRGGGIYNRGTTLISGGSISSNKAASYVSSGRNYGGVGGGICNKGICQVAGGSIYGNHSTVSGGGIYGLSGTLKLSGGSIKGNGAEDGNDIGFYGGDLIWDGAVKVGELWIKNKKSLRLGGYFTAYGEVRIVPESYREGMILARGSGSKKGSKQIVLGGADKNKKTYSLVLSGDLLKLKKKVRASLAPSPTATHSIYTYKTAAPSSTYTKATFKPVKTLSPDSVITTAAPRITTMPGSIASPRITIMPGSIASPVAIVTPKITATPKITVSPKSDVIGDLPAKSNLSYTSETTVNTDFRGAASPTLTPEGVRSFSCYAFTKDDIKKLKSTKEISTDDMGSGWIDDLFRLMKNYKIGG